MTPAPAGPGLYFFHVDQIGAPQAVTAMDQAVWRSLKKGEEPGPGDIAALPRVNDSGHTGINISCECEDGKTQTNIAAHDVTVYADAPQYNKEPGLQYRKYTGG